MFFFSEFRLILISLVIFSRAVSVLWLGRKPDWNLPSKLFALRKSLSCRETIFSKSLLRNGRFDIGL